MTKFLHGNQFVNQKQEMTAEQFDKFFADAKVQLVADGCGEMDLREHAFLKHNVMLLQKTFIGEE